MRKRNNDVKVVKEFVKTRTNCLVCGKELNVHGKDQVVKFCSKECRGKRKRE